jgi:hypothetical protein
MVLVISRERPVPVEPRGTARRLGTAETGATLRPKRVAAKIINPPNEPIPAGMANGRCGAGRAIPGPMPEWPRRVVSGPSGLAHHVPLETQRGGPTTWWRGPLSKWRFNDLRTRCLCNPRRTYGIRPNRRVVHGFHTAENDLHCARIQGDLYGV